MKTVLSVAVAALAGCQPSATESEAAAPEGQPFFTPDPAKMEEAASARCPIVHHPAPDFTLMDQNDKPVTPSKMSDPWIVLYFYPQDDTPGCACQATEFTKLLSDFHGLNAKVYGISSDSTESHRAFIEKYHLRLELLSDPDHKVMAEYGAWVQTHLGDQPYSRVIRTTMIIRPDRTIAWHWPVRRPTPPRSRPRRRPRPATS